MKYRTTLPHRSVTPPKRVVNRPDASIQNRRQTSTAHNTPSIHPKPVASSSPIIDLSETETRMQRLQDTVGAAALVGMSLGRHSLRLLRKAPRSRIVSHSLARSASMHKKFSLSRRRTKSLIVAGLLIVGCIIVYVVSLANRDANTAPSTEPQTTGTKATSPTYNTLSPKNKTITDLGGWSRVSPPDRNPVFAFADTLDGQKISVSQQPLPDSAADNPNDGVRSIAYDFNAKERLTANDGTTYYIGTSSKGPQSVIFTKKGLLILIKSPSTIEESFWSTYISDLQ